MFTDSTSSQIEILEFTEHYIITSKGEIVKEHFKQWLESTGRLEWEYNNPNELTITGKYNADDYVCWSNAEEIERKDLNDYFKQIRFAKLPNLTAAAKQLKSLL